MDSEDPTPLPPPTRPRAIGTVRLWKGEEGSGILESEDTIGGVWAHFGEILGNGFRTLVPGQSVEFDVENQCQDGYDYRASNIRPL